MLSVHLLLLVQLAVGQSLPNPRLEAFVERCETARRGAILQAEHRLRGLQGAPQQTPETTRETTLVQQQLDALRTPNRLFVPPLSFPLQTGAIGEFRGVECYVDQVVGPRELLLRCYFQVPVITVKNYQRHREMVRQSVSVLVRELDTAPYFEGQDARLPGAFEVQRPERYQTNDGGSKNVVVLTPFDLAPAQRILESRTAGKSASR